MLDDITHRDAPVVLGGDLNVFDGFEDDPALRLLIDSGLVDTLREVSDADVTTFEGNTWAPAGRIDYVLATAPVDVLAASVAEDSASDHRPVSATLSFPP
jgi:endonuclease/exonuclease/phosphatase family metal-dependent hydrolase